MIHLHTVGIERVKMQMRRVGIYCIISLCKTIVSVSLLVCRPCLLQSYDRYNRSNSSWQFPFRTFSYSNYIFNFPNKCMYTIGYLYCLLSVFFMFRRSLPHPQGEPCITSQNHVYTRWFISPSGISDICVTVAGMVTPKGNMSVEGETLQLDYRIEICRITKGGHIEHL